MSGVTSYSEATEQFRVTSVELSHLSIETGHFFMRDLTNGTEAIRAHFRRVSSLVDLYTDAARSEFGTAARVSTCFLIDDYFTPYTDPTEILGKILGIADECGLQIDYLAREAGCWETPNYIDGQPAEPSIKLAEMIASRIVAEPIEHTTGKRPPDVDSGWLCNGRRSSDSDPSQAMQVAAEYRSSEEFGRREHSIFLDVELWKKRIGKDGEIHTHWSCPFLASIWQLLRLGMVRNEGRAVVEPQPRGDRWPDRWWEMPSVVQLNPNAQPFAAYQALSILPQSYLKIEHAVRTILDHVVIDQEVVTQTVERGATEGITIPREITQRLSHVFLNEVVKYPSGAPADGA